ncbi:hypothetical protein CRM22_003531 [Opisthorchis felineus]|uniref:Glycoside hydrolase family 5 domain-containing protein n=1 Tax=Opisthorchis felineus TaxID=147828 RepID=A0A4S2M6W2_OPIFE|nr:hypothetical protein CRM22_003531 [Opisthorchis felineus]
MFHGINSVTKQPPWYDKQLLNHSRLRLYRQWGLNVIRLGVMWSGVMPNKSKIDHNYLDKIDAIVYLCAVNDIYVILDMHQDVMSSAFDMYDGIPRWLVDQLPKSPEWLAYPFPLRHPPKNWPLNYLTYAATDCAQHIYANSTGAWVYWGDFWAAVAQKFRSRTNVLGYELINEPPVGNFYKNPLRILPGYMGKHHLLPVYDYLVQRIRQVDSNTLIFYEPMTYSLFLPIVGRTGLSRVPGFHTDPEERNRSVLSYHYYCWVLWFSDPRRKMSWFQRELCDNTIITKAFKTAQASRKKTGGGMFLTGFGRCAPDGNERSINTIECNTILQTADERLQSWTYWGGDFLDDSGKPIGEQLNYFSRPYPQRTMGTSERLKFNVRNGSLEYSFLTKPAKVTQENKIILSMYLPSTVHYPHGMAVYVEPDVIPTEIMGNRLILNVPKEMTNITFSVNVNIRRLPQQNQC